MDDFHVAAGIIMGQYKSNAKSKGLSFELTKDELKEIIKQDCYYCGTPPFSSSITTFQSHGAVLYNGIDRIDNENGYTKDNCVSCCLQCNLAKGRLSVVQFRAWVKRIYVNQFKKLSDKTPGVLFDELCTVDVKCFMAQEIIMNEELSDGDRQKAAKVAQELNVKRNKIIRSIDSLLDFDEDTPSEKTYG